MSPAAPDPRAVESLLAFWRDAGVDALYEDAPVDRTLSLPKAEVRPLTRTVAAVAAAAPNTPSPAEGLAEARRMAAEAADLDALRAAIDNFQGCALRFEGARQAVFARGAPDADIMIVGEAPGADEDAQGAPFVGRAGKLLDRMLAAAGLAERVFITNTVFWRPPGNRNPAPQEQAACAPFVERAIALVQPKLLLFVGGSSAKFMLRRDEGILSIRGRWFDWSPAEGGVSIPSMPTLHPAFLLRQPQAKVSAWRDLLAVSSRLEDGPTGT